MSNDTIKQKFVVDVDGEAKLKSYTGELKKNEKAGEELSKTNDTLTASFKKLAGGLSAIVAVRGIGKFYADSLEFTKKQIESDNRLITLSKNVAKANNEQIKSMMNLADEMQRVTTVGDEVTQVGMSQLVTFGLATESTEKLTESMLDLATAQYGSDISGEQLIQTSNLLGRAYTGQVGALTRVGIILDETQKKMLKNGDEAERVSTLVDIVNQNYGGLAKSMAETDFGKIEQLKNDFGDMREEIGEQLLPVMGEFVDKINDVGVSTIGDKVVALTKNITSFITGVAGGLDVVFSGVSISLLGVTATATKAFSIMNKFNPILFKQAKAAGVLSDSLKQQAIEEAKLLKERVVGYGNLVNGIKEVQKTTAESIGADTHTKPVIPADSATTIEATTDSVKKLKQELGELHTVALPLWMTGDDALTQNIIGAGNAQSEETLSNVQSFMDKYAGIVQQGMSTVSAIFTARYNRQREELDRTMRAEIEAVNESTMSEKKKAKEIKKIEEKARKERHKVALKQWGADIAMSIANTALGVTAALARYDYPGAIATGVLGNVSTGIILANKPKYYYGSRDASGSYSEIGGNSQGDQVNANLRSGELVVQAGKDAQIAKSALNGTTTTNSTSQSLTVSPVINVSGNADESVLMRIPNMIVDTIQNAQFNGLFHPAI